VLRDDFFSDPKGDMKTGEEIVVQIIKEEISDKGPTVSENISIRDREIKVYLYNKKNLHISKKFDSKNRQYLKTFGRLVIPKKLGLSIKKVEKKIFFWELVYRIRSLARKSLIIEEEIKSNTISPCLISPKQEISDAILKKILAQKKTIILVESRSQAFKLRENLTLSSNKNDGISIEYWLEKKSNNYERYIDYLIKGVLRSQIKLTTGGHIIIEKTEALTSIDVNSGSFNKLGSSRETILWINLAATKEIINQLKLKNISGIIVIDFIGMINQDDQLSLLEYLNTKLQFNLTDSKIIQISEIGLVEITKKREGRNIYDIFTKKCSKCQGTGYLKKQELPNKISTSFLEMSSIYG
jgi:ribonuclease E